MVCTLHFLWWTWMKMVFLQGLQDQGILHHTPIHNVLLAWMREFTCLSAKKIQVPLLPCLSFNKSQAPEKVKCQICFQEKQYNVVFLIEEGGCKSYTMYRRASDGPVSVNIWFTNSGECRTTLSLGLTRNCTAYWKVVHHTLSIE